jgi:hypothetical protein
MFGNWRSERTPTVSSDDLRPERVDPERRYPADGLRSVEALALRVLARLPSGEVARTREVIQIDDGGDEGICLVITAEHLELRLPSIEWTCGAYGPARTSVLWKRAKWDGLSDETLDELLTAARRARHAQFRKCRFCGERFPPERRHGNVCHGCAEKHLGVIH